MNSTHTRSRVHTIGNSVYLSNNALNAIKTFISSAASEEGENKTKMWGWLIGSPFDCDLHGSCDGEHTKQDVVLSVLKGGDTGKIFDSYCSVRICVGG